MHMEERNSIIHWTEYNPISKDKEFFTLLCKYEQISVYRNVKSANIKEKCIRTESMTMFNKIPCPFRPTWQ